MRRLLYQLALPLLLLVGTITLASAWPGLQLPELAEVAALTTLLPLLPYLLFISGVVMGWRYNNGGLIFSCLLLSFSYFLITSLAPSMGLPCLRHTIYLILPINLLFFSWHGKRRIFTAFGLITLAIIILELLLLLILTAPSLYQHTTLWGTMAATFPRLSGDLHLLHSRLCALLGHESAPTLFDQNILLLTVFMSSLASLCWRFWRLREVMLAGYLVVLVVLAFAVSTDAPRGSLLICYSGIGLTLLVTTIETSFFMAYYDELTELPGRRSLNEAMLNLGRRYAIAMLDIDHFKKFNDTYGHKTGDDVLRLVAALVSMTGGGAKAYRYGGEEFTIIFPGKSALEAQVHLEKLRQDIADKGFTVRSKSRGKKTAKDRGSKKKQTSKQVNVTISIGVAERTKEQASPEEVIKKADKLLYGAKKAGRNRVKVG